jgi:sugar/nucleoside kinase (ribokinase family)
MKIAAVGVHVLDTHVIGIESIPAGSDGQLVETIRMSPAGTAGGTAIVLSRLGAEVTSYGAVGTDPTGDVLVGLLAAEGVDVSGLVRKDDHQTSASVIPVRPNGDRPAWHCIGANGAFTLDDLPLDALAGITHLHLGGPEFLGGEAAGRLLAHGRSIGAVTSLDILAPGDPDMLAWVADALPHTDYLLPNDEQVLGFTGAPSLVDGARALVAAGVGCVAVTQGAKGALVVTADEVIEVPAYPIEPDRLVDTTGCGDAFSAGFLRGLSLGRDLRGAAELGCATAAQVAQGLGTDAGSYSLDSVVEFAANRV